VLAYPAARSSPAADFGDATWHDGFVKLYLGHSDRGSVLVPAQLFAKAGPWRFFQPSFFGPCHIGFEIQDGFHIADFTVDVTTPQGVKPTRLLVRITSNSRVRTYPDGGQLYTCRLAGPPRLAPHAAGRCQRLEDNDFELTLFHHTNPTAYGKIRASQELWGSRWNLQGTRQLTNVSYVYFTSLPKIRTPDDLERIAMASTGTIYFQTTSNRMQEEVLPLKVYRESTTGRTNTIEVHVPSAGLAPPHLLFHAFVHPNPAYYESRQPRDFSGRVDSGCETCNSANGGRDQASCGGDSTHIRRLQYLIPARMIAIFKEPSNENLGKREWSNTHITINVNAPYSLHHPCRIHSSISRDERTR